MSIYLVVGLVFVYYVIVPILISCLTNKKWPYLVYFLVFIPMLVCGVFSKIDIGKTVTLTFEKSGTFFDKTFNFNPITKDVKDIIINVFMLIPVGVAFYNFASKHKLLHSFLSALIISCLIEILQLILPIARTPQLTDIILNSISGLLGGVFALLLAKIKNRAKSSKNNSKDKYVAMNQEYLLKVVQEQKENEQKSTKNS